MTLLSGSSLTLPSSTPKGHFNASRNKLVTTIYSNSKNLKGLYMRNARPPKLKLIIKFQHRRNAN